jgi:hypothetical protein
MAIVNKIIDTLYEDSKGYYSFPEIIKLGREKSIPLHIEEQRGTTMRWNPDMKSPFDYGEFPNHINMTDGMGWDIIIAPGSQSNDKQLLVCGVVRISPDAENIPYPNGNKQGNHKLILSKDGKITDKEKEDITNYFRENKVFMTPEFFDKKSPEDIIKEDWEGSTMGKMKLGTFKNKQYHGIAVGPTARRSLGAHKFHNTMPKTNPGSVKES